MEVTLRTTDSEPEQRNPVQLVTPLIRLLIDVQTSVERLELLLGARELTDGDVERLARGALGDVAVRIHAASFAWAKDGADVLHEISIEVKVGLASLQSRLKPALTQTMRRASSAPSWARSARERARCFPPCSATSPRDLVRSSYVAPLPSWISTPGLVVVRPLTS